MVRSLSPPTPTPIPSLSDPARQRIAAPTALPVPTSKITPATAGTQSRSSKAASSPSSVACHIGRPVFATNSTGVKVWTATYHHFGDVHTSTGALPTARLPGQWFQSESGLHQNWMRDYDPTTGRYLQADPLGLIDGASVYGYAGQSPMMNMDPTGQCFGPALALLPACVFVAYFVYDYLSDEDCYTMTDYGWFVFDYFMPGPRWKPSHGPADKGSGGGGTPPRKTNPAKGESKVWKELKPFKGDTKTNGKNGKDREYYQWDNTHNDIEVYDCKGRHKGSMDPTTGERYKGPKVYRIEL